MRISLEKVFDSLKKNNEFFVIIYVHVSSTEKL